MVATRCSRCGYIGCNGNNMICSPRTSELVEMYKTMHENEVFINPPKKKINLTEEEIKDLKLIRNYFGENDKTPFEHLAFAVLDRIIKKSAEKT